MLYMNRREFSCFANFKTSEEYGFFKSASKKDCETPVNSMEQKTRFFVKRMSKNSISEFF